MNRMETLLQEVQQEFVTLQARIHALEHVNQDLRARIRELEEAQLDASCNQTRPASVIDSEYVNDSATAGGY